MRTSAIGALAQLEAAEALPRLRALLDDPALPRAADQIPVSERAKAAIAVIERALRQKRSPPRDPTSLPLSLANASRAAKP